MCTGALLAWICAPCVCLTRKKPCNWRHRQLWAARGAKGWFLVLRKGSKCSWLLSHPFSPSSKFLNIDVLDLTASPCLCLKLAIWELNPRFHTWYASTDHWAAVPSLHRLVHRKLAHSWLVSCCLYLDEVHTKMFFWWPVSTPVHVPFSKSSRHDCLFVNLVICLVG